RQLRRQAAADDAAAAAEDRDPDAVEIRLGEEPLFRRTALPAQRLPLRQRQLRRPAPELLLDEHCEREVEIVSSEEQMLADCDALERQLAAFAGRPDQAEVRGAAA